MSVRTIVYCVACVAWITQVSVPFCPHAVAAKVHGQPIEDGNSNAPDMPTNIPFGLTVSSSDTVSITASVAAATATGYTAPATWSPPAVFDWVNGAYIEVTKPENHRKGRAEPLIP